MGLALFRQARLTAGKGCDILQPISEAAVGNHRHTHLGGFVFDRAAVRSGGRIADRFASQ